MAAARKAAKQVQLEAAPLDPVKSKGKKGKGGKAKARAKVKEKGDSKGSEPPGLSKVEFPDKLCPNLRQGQECRYGKVCRLSHEKRRFDAD